MLIGLIAWAVIRRQVAGQCDSPPSPLSPPTTPPSPQTKQVLVKDPVAAPSFSPAFGHAHLVTASTNGPIHYQHHHGQTMATVSTGASFPATLSVQPPMVYLVQAQPQQQLGTGGIQSHPSPTDGGSTHRTSAASIPFSEKELILP
ncbi:hypothetical protein BCR44DRAFT_35452 [Catenaria anguillulae PL171]|uniref:Uncharacterized protein n=1 Tax=Catenaria anguillulae PL171 TaxID=765915 RepID=A0A1Y2HQ40_9FUNG|nr:hypothetical protein BCR44DRAFT_35452 [Catenaria anguillulae PL171]